MSLDLSNKAGRAHNVALFAAVNLAGVTAATFDSGDIANAGKFLLHVTTDAGDIDAATLPASMFFNGEEMLIDGVEVTIVKNSPDNNKITFIDPITGINYSYVNRAGESITLVIDTSVTPARWVAKI